MRSSDGLVRRPVSRLAPLRMARRPCDDALAGQRRRICGHCARRPSNRARKGPSASRRMSPSVERRRAREPRATIGGPRQKGGPRRRPTRDHGPIHPGPIPVRNKGGQPRGRVDRVPDAFAEDSGSASYASPSGSQRGGALGPLLAASPRGTGSPLGLRGKEEGPGLRPRPPTGVPPNEPAECAPDINQRSAGGRRWAPQSAAQRGDETSQGPAKLMSRGANNRSVVYCRLSG